MMSFFFLRPNRPKRLTRLISGTLLALPLLTMAQPGGGPQRPLPVVVAAVEDVSAFGDSLEALGTTLANESVTLTANATELVESIHFEDGQFVRRGDVLVLLEKQDGRVLFAESVVDSSIPALEGNEVADVLGPPDSVPNYRSPEQPVCDMENGTLALLGSGFVVVKMPEPIEVGDCVAIIDVGECDFPYGQVSIEPMYAQVSVAPTPDNSYWVTLGQGAGVYVSLSVTSLPDLRE